MPKHIGDCQNDVYAGNCSCQRSTMFASLTSSERANLSRVLFQAIRTTGKLAQYCAASYDLWFQPFDIQGELVVIHRELCGL